LNFIQYGRQWIDDEDIEEVVKVLKGPLITTGPKVKEFEEAISEYTNSKFAVAVTNGTTALTCACIAANINEGDEVITTPMTFAASANCVLYRKAKPVFTDILPDTYNIDPNSIEKKINNKTKAIIAVDFTGQPVELEEIKKIAKENKLLLIEDGAHALGAQYKGSKIGSISDLTTFSFHPVKNITTGEGGIITTNNEEHYKKMMLYRTHGITRNEELLVENHGTWYYEQQLLGDNLRMTDFQAALGISQLKKIDKFNSRRREISEKYDASFKDLEGIIIQKQIEDTISARHIYIIQLELEKLQSNRKEIFDELYSRNIGVNVHYIPVYYHPYYKGLGYKKGLCPIAEDLYERIITIPLYPKMTDEEVDYVIENVINIIDKHRKDI
jgi:perosamine synthetase